MITNFTDLLNFFILRYLWESGFWITGTHFTIEAVDSLEKRQPEEWKLVTQSALITVVKKGLLFTAMEATMGDNDFIMDLITKNPKELMQILKEKVDENQTDREMVTDKLGKITIEQKEVATINKEPQLRDTARKSAFQQYEIPHSDVTNLEGHTSEAVEGEAASCYDKMITNFNTDLLNFLIFRYLRESGFRKTGSYFMVEAVDSLEKRQPEERNLVPQSALITIVKKGLFFTAMEAKMVDNGFTMDLITKNPKELLQILKEKVDENQTDREMVTDKLRKVTIEQKEVATISKEPQLRDTARKSAFQQYEIPHSDVTSLEGHTSEVCTCAWSPGGSLIWGCSMFCLLGSTDSTVRTLSIMEGVKSSSAVKILQLNHTNGGKKEDHDCVTKLDWNVEGTLLATGTCDGDVRIWSRNGMHPEYPSLLQLNVQKFCELRTTLGKHTGHILSLKWNKNGDYLVTGSSDSSAIVWDVKSENMKQQFKFHSGPILDVDWLNSESFATCSKDKFIYVCKIGENQPLKAFVGHQGGVNCVSWDPTSSFLASCSNDNTAKIWSMICDRYIHDLREHSKEVFTIRWSPCGPGTTNPNHKLTLASASFDKTVKLWDIEHGKSICTLDGHRDPVYSIAFSPDGEYIASGSHNSVLIWSIKDGKIVQTYSGLGRIYEVGWDNWRVIAAERCANKPCVFDFRM